MDLSAITSLNGIGGMGGVSVVRDITTLTNTLPARTENADGTMFDAFLNTAIDNIKHTNSYLSDWENEEIKFAMGETQNTHDLMIALEKASTALQYTVAIRDKVMEAYRELMQIQI